MIYLICFQEIVENSFLNFLIYKILLHLKQTNKQKNLEYNEYM